MEDEGLEKTVLLKEINANLTELVKTSKDILDFFYSMEERELTETDSRKYLEELKKDNFHPQID